MPAHTELDLASVLEFVVECRETVDQTERSIVQWEKEPKNRQALDQIFRGFHTLKGTCGFLGFEQLESLAHQVENLLTRIRDENLAVNATAVTVVLKVIDAIRFILKNVEETGEEGEGDYEVLVAELKLKTLQKQLESTSEVGRKISKPAIAEPATGEQSIRVEVSALDRLSKLADELKRIHAQVAGSSAANDGNGLTGSLSRMGLVVLELETTVGEMRLQTFEKTWEILPRLVRDVAASLGKKVQLQITGEKTKIDASLVPGLRDVMTHLIRNCIDHGIESPERRLAAGKPEEGLIQLRSMDHGENMIIEVEDDGVGILPATIREKALKGSFMAAEELDLLDEREILQLIFLPGFSTAREVTKLSGRGVGLDVVRTRLKDMAGTVEVVGRPGQGALFRILLPQTKSESKVFGSDNNM